MGRCGVTLMLTLAALGPMRIGHAQVVTPSVESVIYDPDLTSLVGFSGKICRSTVGDGGLIVTNVSSDTYCALRMDKDQGFNPSYRIEAEVRQRQGPSKHFGLFFGDRVDQDRTSYATLTISNAGEAALEWWQPSDKKWIRIAPAKPAPVPRSGAGAINRVMVEVKGSEVTGYLNDQLVASDTIAIPLDGLAGIYVDQPGQEVIVTEFKVTALASAPATRTTTAPAPTSPSLPTVPPLPTPPATLRPTAGTVGGTDFKMTPGGGAFVDDDLATTERLPVEAGPPCTTAYADGGFAVTGGPTGCEWEAEYLTEGAIRARFEVSMRILKGDEGGFIFGKTRRTDSLHYHFKLTTTGLFTLERSQNQNSSALITWSMSPAIRSGLGATNRLAVEVLGQELRLFINGQPVGRVTSPHVVQGGYGFHVVSANGRVVFNNLKITDFNAGTTVAREASGGRAVAAGTATRKREITEVKASDTATGRPKG